MKFASASRTALRTVFWKNPWIRLMMKPQKPEPSRVTLPTVTLGEPETAARSLPPWSWRLNPTVALIELAWTWIVEPPGQQKEPHASTDRRTFGSVTWASRPPGTSASVLLGVSQLTVLPL